MWYDSTQFWVPTCCSQSDYFPPNMGIHHKDIAAEKVSKDDNNNKSTINCTIDRMKMVVYLPSHAVMWLSTLSTPAAFATNLASLMSLRWHLCCIALLTFHHASWLLPVASALLLASLLHVSLLADFCVHPPLLPPPAIVTSRTLCHRTPHCKCIVSSTSLLSSTLLSFWCAGWLLPNRLSLLLVCLPLLRPLQYPCCTGLLIAALASLPSLPPTATAKCLLPLKIASP